jgi:hypothetical protein
VLDRRGQQLLERQATEALVQRHPAVHAAGERSARWIPGHRQPRKARGAKPLRIGARAGSARRVQSQRDRIAITMDERQQVAPKPALMLLGEREHGAGGDRGVGRGAPGPQRLDPGLRREVVDRADDRLGAEARAVRRERRAAPDGIRSYRRSSPR